MFRVSLLFLLLLMLPALLVGQATIPLSSSDATHKAGAASRDDSANAMQNGASTAAQNNGQTAAQGSAPAPAANTTPRQGHPAGPLITLDQAIQLALTNSPTIKAARTQI